MKTGCCHKEIYDYQNDIKDMKSPALMRKRCNKADVRNQFIDNKESTEFYYTINSFICIFFIIYLFCLVFFWGFFFLASLFLAVGFLFFFLFFYTTSPT